MGWFGFLITRKSPERTTCVYDYRVHLAADQNSRSIKPSLAAFNTENTATVGVWDLPWLINAEQAGGAVRGGGQNSQLGGSKADGESPAVNSRGGSRTQFVHGRSRMTIAPRILTIPGRSTSGFHQPGRHCLHQARSAVRCSASRMKGELHLSKNRSYDGLRHFVPTFLLTDDSGKLVTLFSGVSTPGIAIGITM